MSRKVAAVAALACVMGVAVAASPLGPYKVNPKKVTTGGLSAGAFAAVQFQVAYSSSVFGVSVFAGGPYYCAQNSLTTAEMQCMYAFESVSVPYLWALTQDNAKAGNIDPVSNLNGLPVYVYSGTYDTVVNPKVNAATEAFFKLAGANVTGVFTIPSEHCYPTLDFGETCSSLGSPYIGNCDYDGAGVSLAKLYGTLKPKASTFVAANLMQFDQTKFGTGNSLNSIGYIYVPTACQNGDECGLHVTFHGCQQTTADIGEEFPQHVGLNEWAETNNIIVLYPQVSKSDLFPSNPEGCFDWWGYTNGNYANKDGVQMKFTYDIMQAVMGGNTLTRTDTSATA